MGDTYSHGHQESVLRSHRWRTAENSAAYLLPHLEAGQRLLDVGCGPGTLTVDLARLVAPGAVVGIDVSQEVVAEAAGHAAGVDNVEFRVDDAFGIEAADASFDVVHAHQVLQHLTEPVRALREWRRVLRPGALLAVRDSDYAAKVWAPDDPVLDRWLALYQELTHANGVESNAGRYLLGWVQEAGFDDAVFTSSTWSFADPATRQWWGDLWAERVVSSSFAEQTLAYGLSTIGELEEISAAFRRWSAAPDATFIVVLGEVIAHR